MAAGKAAGPPKYARQSAAAGMQAVSTLTHKFVQSRAAAEKVGTTLCSTQLLAVNCRNIVVIVECNVAITEVCSCRHATCITKIRRISIVKF